MSAEFTSERLVRRIHDVLDEYATPEFVELRREFDAWVGRVDALIPMCPEKILFLRKMLEAAHLLSDAVEMNR